jgi:gliding motility-associated lipoprotein GldH
MIMPAILKNRTLVLFVLAALVMSSCNRNVVYSEYKTFTDNQWYVKDKAVFDLDIEDIQTPHNISLMVRHSDSYPFRNLFLFVTTKYPDGKMLTDTMEVVLANERGEWDGTGMGDIFDFKIPVKKNVRFPLPGHYQFSFEQGMRTDPLPLIMDFGFEIEKSK